MELLGSLCTLLSMLAMMILGGFLYYKIDLTLFYFYMGIICISIIGMGLTFINILYDELEKEKIKQNNMEIFKENLKKHLENQDEDNLK